MYSQTFTMDVVIKVEGDEREIKAHRNILIGASDYFHSLFTDNFQEKDSKEVVLKEVCFDTLQMLVEFIYTGKLSFEKCSVRQAIELADYLMIDCAIENLNDHISKNSSKENCLEYYGAFKLLRDDVRDQLETCIRKNLIEFHRRPDFLSLTLDQFKSILSNPTPVDQLYDLAAVVAWTNNNKGYQYVPQLLPLVVYRSTISMKYYFEDLLPACKCAESREFCIALLARANGHNNEFTQRFFNEKNWKC